MTREEANFVCSLFNHDCECCPYNEEQKDEEGNIVPNCTVDNEEYEDDL